MIERIIDAEYTAEKQEGTVPPCENSVVTVTGTYTYEFTLEEGDSLSDIDTTDLTEGSTAIDGDTTYEWDGTQWVNQSACDPFIPENQPTINLTLQISKTVDGVIYPLRVFPMFSPNVRDVSGNKYVAVQTFQELAGSNPDGSAITYSVPVGFSTIPIIFRVLGPLTPSTVGTIDDDPTKISVSGTAVRSNWKTLINKKGAMEAILLLGDTTISVGAVKTVNVTYTE